jgi:hypothetical protein
MLSTMLTPPEQKPNYEDYPVWLRQNHDVVLSRATENHYTAVVQQVRAGFDRCPLWLDIISGLPNLDDGYLIRRKTPLLLSHFPSISLKSYDSFIRKTYRKNIILNHNFPGAPADGWMLPPDWFSLINDIVRTRLVVRYLDGVEYLLGYIQELTQKHNITLRQDYEARLEGYYALHLYYAKSLVIPKPDFLDEQRSFQFEIQITTQIKEIIHGILHMFYEKARMIHETTERDWRWDYKSDEFVANNLGHILHYIEGTLVQVRDRQMGV